MKSLNERQIFIIATLIAEGIKCMQAGLELVRPDYDYYDSRKDFYDLIERKIKELLAADISEQDVNLIFESIKRQKPRICEIVLQNCYSSIAKVDTEEVIEQLRRVEKRDVSQQNNY